MHTFGLTRYFSALSLLAIIVASGLVGTLVRVHEIGQMEYLAQNRSVSMARVFQNLLAVDIDRLVARAEDGDSRVLKALPEVGMLREKLLPLLRDSGIVKIKVYNLKGTTVFSTDPVQIGVEQGNNAGFIAARDGRVGSELTHRDRFDAFEGEKHDIDLVSSYIPVSDGRGVFAVLELYQDVTPLMAYIDDSLRQLWVIIGLAAVALYLMLRVVVGRAQREVDAHAAMLQATNQDLDQRVAERTEALRKSEARLRVIVDTARDAIITLDADGRVVSWNPAAETMFGYKADEVAGRSIALILPERFRQEQMAFYQQLMAGTSLQKSGVAAILTGLRKDGSEFPLDHSMAVWEMPEGRFFTTIIRDITERQYAQTELSIAAAAFDTQEGVIVTDANSMILRVNKAFCDSTGYSAEDVIGKRPSLLRSDRHDNAFFAAMWESIRRTGSWQGEIWDRHKSGKVYPKWLTISAVRNQDGVVTHYVGTHLDITERKVAEERIKHLAYFDQLTDLPNRSLLMDRLRQTMIASERSRAHGALIFLDLDRFKELNDTLGHDHGDQLLRQVAVTLTESVRQSDTVARLGGDEFVIVLGDLESSLIDAAASVEVLCRKLLAALKRDCELNGAGFHGSASIGATLFVGQETSTEELLKQADLAMYKSKEAGRNTFNFFDPEMEASVKARAQMEADLYRALQEDQFIVYYQPVVDGASQRVVGCEALVRWLHPEKGVLPPVQFIPNAEESGLIVPIGQWVLLAACRQLACWAQQPSMAHLSIAVNVSVNQFRRPDFVDQVISVLQQTGATPALLKLELTESLFVDDVEDVIGKMMALKTLGVGFSLDDFGTGYSSLAYLSRLPLDQLKIDRSFVYNLDVSDNNVAICAATISLAHALKLKVVAEGVETEMQRYFLSVVHRCDLLQGYLLSRPLPLPEFEAWCAANLRS